MYLNYSTLLFCFVSISTFGQTLTIANGRTEKSFKPNAFYEIILREGSIGGKEDCCESIKLSGSLSGVSKDSLYMQLSSYVHIKRVDDIKVEQQVFSKSGNNYGSFARHDIFSIEHHKSLKSKKRKDAFTVIGGLLLFTGIVTAANYSILSDDKSKTSILKSGGIQVGVGIGFIIARNSRKYRFKGTGEIWWIK